MYQILFKKKTGNVFIQMIRYSMSGFIAFSVDISILFLLTEFAKVNYLVAAIIAFSVGMTIIYLLSIRWVFSSRSSVSRHKEISVFFMIGIIGLGLNEVIIWSFTEFIHFHYMISKLFSTTIVFFWNFFNRKYLLFN